MPDELFRLPHLLFHPTPVRQVFQVHPETFIPIIPTHQALQLTISIFRQAHNGMMLIKPIWKPVEYLVVW
jgi:hypothetical protein